MGKVSPLSREQYFVQESLKEDIKAAKVAEAGHRSRNNCSSRSESAALESAKQGNGTVYSAGFIFKA